MRLLKQPLFATGFRSFFLLAALMAVVWVIWWLLWLFGLAAVDSRLGPLGWHAHEMIFGYATAVLAGFLLTAVMRWTGRPTASGGWLAALVLLWIAGRVVLAIPRMSSWVTVMILDVAFLPALAVACMRPIVAARNWRNMAFGPLLAAMALANLALHLEQRGLFIGSGPYARRVALDAVLVMIAIVGGRIVPQFTGNALSAVRIRPRGWLDRLALIALGALLVADTVPRGEAVAAAIALIAGALHLARMRGWGSLATLRHPFLGVLHLGYLWLPVGMLLHGAAHWVSAIPVSSGLHALTVGAIGTSTLGMMTRVALGHTGRPLRIGAPVVLSYLLLTAAALVRVIAPFSQELYRPGLMVSVILWSSAFAIYLLVYTPILVRPRVDGKPG